MTVILDGKELEPGDVIFNKNGSEFTVVKVSTYSTLNHSAWVLGDDGREMAASFGLDHSWRLKKLKFEVGKAYVPKVNSKELNSNRLVPGGAGPYDIEPGQPIRVAYIEPNGLVITVYRSSTNWNTWKTWSTTDSWVINYKEVED